MVKMNVTQRKIAYEFIMERFKAFNAQNSEDGNFDVIFAIDGKKLYAHKFMLCPISPTFKTMLSDRWTKPDEPVKIVGYAFDDFKEFLTFIYSGKCKLTDANIFAMVDIAEFYGVKRLKDVCEKYLTGMLNLENVFQMIELVDKYSLERFKKSLNAFIGNNVAMFCKSPQFKFLQKLYVKNFVEAHQESSEQEEMFEAVFEWSENQANKKQKSDKSLDFKEIMKGEIVEFLPLIKFEKLKRSFLIKFIVRKHFLLSDDQLYDILWARYKLFVKVIGKNGKLLKGEVRSDDNESVANVIQSIKGKNCFYLEKDLCAWIASQPEPSTPSKLIVNDKIEWYLFLEHGGNFVVARRSEVHEGHHLLAEMFAENGFELSDDCKIEIC